MSTKSIFKIALVIWFLTSIATLVISHKNLNHPLEADETQNFLVTKDSYFNGLRDVAAREGVYITSKYQFWYDYYTSTRWGQYTNWFLTASFCIFAIAYMIQRRLISSNKMLGVRLIAYCLFIALLLVPLIVNFQKMDFLLWMMEPVVH